MGESSENGSQQATSPAATPRFPEFAFIGPHGLRAGWRVLLYLAAYYVFRSAFLFLSEQLISPDSHQLRFFLVSEFVQFLAAAIPAVILARIEGIPFGRYGLPQTGAFGKLFWAGMLWGVVAITLLLTVMRGLGVFYFGGAALHGSRVLKYAAFWGLAFLLVGFFEEFLFRGYNQLTLTQGIGFWPAAILLSTVFGGSHLENPGEAWIGALGAAFIGLFWCLTLRRTGSLWFAVGMHASWDWGETFLYSVPNSGLTVPGHLLKSSFHGSRWLTGGSVGPEGSVLVFVLIALMWLVFDRMYPAQSSPAS
jgi:CAAX protease family protein